MQLLVLIFIIGILLFSKNLIDEKILIVHEAYCRRNNVVCVICGKSYDKNLEEEHF